MNEQEHTIEQVAEETTEQNSEQELYNEETSEPEAEQSTAEQSTAEQPETQEPKQEEKPQERNDHPNFRKMRQQNQALYQKNSELEQTLKKLEEKINADAEQFEDPETRRIKKIEEKLSKYEKKEKEQEMQQKLYSQAQEAHNILGKVFDDFDIVYNEKNVDEFYDKYPEIERRVQQKAHAFGYEEAAEYAYMRMKEKGYGKKQVEAAVKESRVAKNKAKPQHASPMGQVASAQRESTLDQKAKTRAETDRIIKGY